MAGCKICKHYTPLAEPKSAGQECFVYGFCFVDYHGGYGSAYPVYIPDATCKRFAKRKGAIEPEPNIAGQMNITDFPEVLP